MKFYNREKELQILSNMAQQATVSSRMTVIVGRRRVGKTTLVREAYPQSIYLFVSRKDEYLLCEEFCTIIQEKLQKRIIGSIANFRDLFEYLLQYAEQQPITVVIDEFQEFFSLNAAVYSEMQNLWDQYKGRTKMNLVLSGSIYSLMKKIFEDRKEPLFGRADQKIHLKPFPVATLKEILTDYAPEYRPEDFLALYVLTGGVAKYVEYFVNHHAFTKQEQLDLVFDEHSLFLDEGKNLLIEEFGKEYTTYFSILSLIASGKTARSDIESVLGKTLGGFLDRLEAEYGIIEKVKPIFAKEGSRKLKYRIVDNFLAFWFRFIYKHKSAIEIGNYPYVKGIVNRDFATFSGPFLEKYFVEMLRQTGRYSAIGAWWGKKNEDEIDIVAVNEESRTLLIAEVKLNKKNINLTALAEKAQTIVQQHQGYDVRYAGYSLEDI